MRRIALIATLALMIVATSCKTTQVTTATHGDILAGSRILPKEQQLFNNMINAYGEWNDFVAKGSITAGKMSSDFEIRMINNEAIQISIRPALGIEVARVIITPEEVIAYEKMGRRYISGSMESLNNRLPFNVTLEDIQNIFLGRPFIIGAGGLTTDDFTNLEIELDGEEWSMTPIKQYNNFNYNFALSGTTLTTSLANDINKQHEVKCNYEEIETIDNTLTPKKISVSMTNEKQSVSCTIKYKSVKWNSDTSIEKLSTARYTRITADELKKMLKK